MQFLRVLSIFSAFLAYGFCAPIIITRSDEHSSSSFSDSSSDRSGTPPPPRNHGEFVGVRPKAYEQKTKENNLKNISIHPGVVVGGPDPETGKYDVAMISKKLPHDPPQAPITNYHPAETVYGNVALSPPKKIKPKHMKGWVNQKTGVQEKEMSAENLAKLKKDMEPHAGWRAPTPPPKPPTPPPKSPTPPQSPSFAKKPKRAKKGKQSNVQAEASQSKHAIPGSPQGGTKQAASSKQNAVNHGHPGRPGSPSGGARHVGSANQQHGKAPKRSSSPSGSNQAHVAKKVPRRGSSPGPRPKTHNGGAKPAQSGAKKAAPGHTTKHK
ncbi:hypothetical protein JR316_0005358 [Psilocybe cubensis]|uniref:Uncharacterized protein n=2 Tax=Psilocybe cubensis TaxID=181762 RepID=A0A8H7XMG0_PSICU|nr:hypothetical protein JR316_0005358 [Psilocybe cubensis]KAH9483254.1 hypothetical protein JR316_0005358 [Psilocybe cubensis]